MASISPILSASQLETLAELGEERTAAVGEVLYGVGDERYPFIAILEGEAAILDAAGDEIVRHGPSGFLGELNLMTGQTVYLTAMATQPMRYIAVDRDVLRPLLFEDGPLGDVLLSAFIARREALQQHQGIGLEIVGPRSSAATREMVDYVRRARLPHTWRDPEHDDPSAAALIAADPAGGAAARAAAGRHRAAPAERRRGVARAGHRRRARRPRGGRPRRGRRRAGRSRRRGLRRVGGARHADHREHGARRPGRRLAADRELPRLPGRHQRHRADHPRGHAGAQVRRADGDPVPRRRARAGRRPPRRAARRRDGDRRARGRPGHRRRVPPPAGRRPRRLRGHQRLLRRRARPRPSAAARRASRSSAAATPPRRPRSGCRAAARS